MVTLEKKYGCLSAMGEELGDMFKSKKRVNEYGQEIDAYGNVIGGGAGGGSPSATARSDFMRANRANKVKLYAFNESTDGFVKVDQPFDEALKRQEENPDRYVQKTAEQKRRQSMLIESCIPPPIEMGNETNPGLIAKYGNKRGSRDMMNNTMRTQSSLVSGTQYTGTMNGGDTYTSNFNNTGANRKYSQTGVSFKMEDSNGFDLSQPMNMSAGEDFVRVKRRNSGSSNRSNSPSKGAQAYYGDSPTRSRNSSPGKMGLEPFRPLSHPEARHQIRGAEDGYGTSSMGIIRTRQPDEEI